VPKTSFIYCGKLKIVFKQLWEKHKKFCGKQKKRFKICGKQLKSVDKIGGKNCVSIVVIHGYIYMYLLPFIYLLYLAFGVEFYMISGDLKNNTSTPVTIVDALREHEN
jgi:hypothetical protein